MLKKSLAQENYVKTLVIKGTCQVKENVIDYADHELDPQLVNDLMNFIEKEISKGKYSKKDFDKSKILQDIIVSIFGDLSESELKWLVFAVFIIVRISVGLALYLILIVSNEDRRNELLVSSLYCVHISTILATISFFLDH